MGVGGAWGVRLQKGGGPAAAEGGVQIGAITGLWYRGAGDGYLYFFGLYSAWRQDGFHSPVDITTRQINMSIMNCTIPPSSSASQRVVSLILDRIIRSQPLQSFRRLLHSISEADGFR